MLHHMIYMLYNLFTFFTQFEHLSFAFTSLSANDNLMALSALHKLMLFCIAFFFKISSSFFLNLDQ